MAEFRSLLALAVLYSQSAKASPRATFPAQAALVRSHRLNTPEIVGIAIGATLLGLSALVFCWLSQRKSSRVDRLGTKVLSESESTSQSSIVLSKPQDRQPTSTKKIEISTPEATLHDESVKQNSLLMIKPVDVSQFIELINLYGENGIILRELLMLASRRYPSCTETPKMDTRPTDKNVHLGKDLEKMNFMQCFALDASRPGYLFALRNELESQGQIMIRHPSSQAIHNYRTWSTDSQVWTVGTYKDCLSKAERTEFYTALIRFVELPDERSLCIQRRQMELFYNHARLVGIYICQKALATPMCSITELGISEVLKERYIYLMMRVLIHRHREGDGKVMDDLLRLMDESDLDSALHPRTHVMWEWAQIKRELATGIHGSPLAIATIARVKNSTSWSHGVTGLLLADSIQSFKTLKDFDAVEYILSLSKEWCDMAYPSKDHEAMSALCILLPQLELWDPLAGMPEEYHLECGYHLSRLGYPELAERFLASRIPPGESQGLTTWWRYSIELLSVKIRLGRWQEAEDELQSSLKTVTRRYEDAPFDTLDHWQLTGELGEFKLSLKCLLADCFMANGRFLEAMLLLKDPLEEIQGMRDHYTISMRVALQSRLLHAQMHIEDFAQAKETSLRQCRDVLGLDDFSLERATVIWVVDELLMCINELVGAKMLSGAMEILDRLVAAQSRKTLLTEEIQSYVQRRHQAISRLIAAERPLLTSESGPQNTINTSRKYPESLEKPTQDRFLRETYFTTANKPLDPALRTKPKPLHETVSESLKKEHNSLGERFSGIAGSKRPIKQGVKARMMSSPEEMRKLSLLRLSRLPPTPKTLLRLSRSSSPPESDAHLSWVSPALEKRDYQTTGFPLIVEETYA